MERPNLFTRKQLPSEKELYLNPCKTYTCPSSHKVIQTVVGTVTITNHARLPLFPYYGVPVVDEVNEARAVFFMEDSPGTRVWQVYDITSENYKDFFFVQDGLDNMFGIPAEVRVCLNREVKSHLSLFDGFPESQDFETLEEMWHAIYADSMQVIAGIPELDLESEYKDVTELSEDEIEAIKKQAAVSDFLEKKGLTHFTVKDGFVSIDVVEVDKALGAIPFLKEEVPASLALGREGLAKVLAYQEFDDKLEDVAYILGSVTKDILSGELTPSVDIHNMSLEELVEELEKRST